MFENVRNRWCTSEKQRKNFDFRVNTPTSFPESGSRKDFHASGMRAIVGVRWCTGEKRKFIDFRVNTPILFPESGSR
jgi:hypothetical protein